jgi:hypothetical protein
MTGRSCTTRAVNHGRDVRRGWDSTGFGQPAREPLSGTASADRDGHALRLRSSDRGSSSPETGLSGAVSTARFGARCPADPSARVRSGATLQPLLSGRTAKRQRRWGPGSPGRRRRTSRRKQAQEGADLRRRQRRRKTPDPDDGARPRSRRSAPSLRDRPGTGNGTRRDAAVMQRERQGGNGCSDAERLSAGNSSKGGPASRGRVDRQGSSRTVSTAPKRGEPQDRQRDATSPQRAKRRKPSRWCETTRMEQDFRDGLPGAEGTAGRCSGSGRFDRMSMEGRTAHRSARVRGCVNRIPGEKVVYDQGVRVAPEWSARERLADSPSGASRAVRGRPQGPAGNGEGRRGGRKDQRPATRIDRAIPAHRKMNGGHEPPSA